MKNWLKDNRGFLIFIVCFAFFRTAMADWNPIPSGSMRPTIVEGDVVFVNRLAYNLKLPLTDVVLARLADPQRGDIVTFSSPRDGMRLIKRLVAVPGDTVAMRNDVLYINGVPAVYSGEQLVHEQLAAGIAVEAIRAREQIAGAQRQVQFLRGFGSGRSFEPQVVPSDQYFMLGDNRNNSEDSRFIGFVPRRLIIGQAVRILVSADINSHWRPRFERTISPLQ